MEIRNLVVVVLFIFQACQGFSQTPKDLAVQLTAKVTENPNSMALQWPVTNANTIKIYRRSSTNNKSFLTPLLIYQAQVPSM